jgi:uncharacterized protein (TIGR03000 family)
MIVLLGSAQTSSAQFFITFGRGAPRFGYVYGYGGPWGYAPGGFGFFPHSYPPISYYYGYGSPFGIPSASYLTNPYYNGYAAALGAQANYLAPAAYSSAPVSSGPFASSGPEDVAPTRPARVIVHAPADAELWFDGHRTTQTGDERLFTTPALEKGSTYHYDVRARWMSDGKAVEQTQSVQVYAGGEVHVTFPRKK